MPVKGVTQDIFLLRLYFLLKFGSNLKSGLNTYFSILGNSTFYTSRSAVRLLRKPLYLEKHYV